MIGILLKVICLVVLNVVVLGGQDKHLLFRVPLISPCRSFATPQQLGDDWSHFDETALSRVSKRTCWTSSQNCEILNLRVLQQPVRHGSLGVVVLTYGGGHGFSEHRREFR